MGELAALGASVCWAAASIAFTRLRASAGAMALNLVKCVLGLAMMGIGLWVFSGSPLPRGTQGTDALWLIVSGLVGLTIGDSCYFLALSRIGPRRTLLLSALTPPITALLAWPALGEPLTGQMGIGMVLTLAGVGWVVSERSKDGPGEGALEPTRAEPARAEPTRGDLRAGFALALGAAACQAGANVLTKLGDSGAGALELSTVRLAAGTVGLCVAVAARGELRSALRPLRVRRFALAVVAATFVGTFLGIWLQVTGLVLAPAGVAATLSSTAPIFVLPLAVVVLGERIGLRAVLGAAVAVAGVAVFFLR